MNKISWPMEPMVVGDYRMNSEEERPEFKSSSGSERRGGAPEKPDRYCLIRGGEDRRHCKKRAKSWVKQKG